MIRSVRSASLRSWVTTRKVTCWSRFTSRSSEKTSSAVWVSRFPGRLVGQHDLGVHGEGTGDGDPLGLPAGQGGGPGVGAGGEPHAIEQRAAAVPHRGLEAPRVGGHGDDDVLQRREPGQEVVELEDEAEGPPPATGEPVVVEGARVLAVEDDPAVGGLVEQSHEVQERALSRARGSHQRRELPAAQREVDPAEHPGARLPLPEVAGDPLQPEDVGARFTHSGSPRPARAVPPAWPGTRPPACR